jgi:valyl-tRNA synthetase
LREIFHGILKLLHPVMPFATEEMASVMGEQALLATQSFPEPDPARRDEEADRLLDRTRRAVSAVRSFRAESKVDGQLAGLVPHGIDEGVFAALAGVRPVEAADGASRASLPAGDVVVEILLSDEMRRGEIERLRREISHAEREVARSQSKLANEKFVTNAPEKVVAGEREKLDVNSRMLETLSRRLDEYI